MIERRAGFVLLLGVVAVLGIGCTNTATYSCTFPAALGYCYEWIASPPLTNAEINTIAAGCSSATIGTGTFSNGGSCSSTNRLGVCSLPYSVAGVTYQWSYYSPPFTASTAQSGCITSGGIWSAG